MLNFPEKEKYDTKDLCHLISLLRSENGCPWDKVQTHESIRRNFLEEVYEAVEAIDSGNTELLCEELGDVLMQVAFHTEMEREAGRFDLDDVADGVCRKLLFRHPHLFTENAEAVDWETIKRQEKNVSSLAQDLDRVSRCLPGTWRWEKLLKKSAKAEKLTVDNQALCTVVQQSAEALAEGKQEKEKNCQRLLTAAVALAYENGLDPEALLHKSADSFVKNISQAEKEKHVLLSNMIKQN